MCWIFGIRSNRKDTNHQEKKKPSKRVYIIPSVFCANNVLNHLYTKLFFDIFKNSEVKKEKLASNKKYF